MRIDTHRNPESRSRSMLASKLLAFLLLMIVVTSAAWLVLGWRNLLGPPSNRDRVVFTISPATSLVREDGRAR